MNMINKIFGVLALIVGFGCASNTSTQSQIGKNDSVVTYKKVTPEWTKNSNIYEVNIRQYTSEGTFNEFANHIPRLKEMGVDILWLMPIHPIGEKNRKGSLGSYYAVKDYRAVNPEFGTLEDFKTLVKKVHEAGMHIIIDWVANHTAPDCEWVTKHPDWFTKDEKGNIVAPVADWTDVADLNYDNPALRKEMTECLKFWVKVTNIDGFRCDVADMVPVNFWDSARVELDKIKPVFMLAEAENPLLHKSAFDMSYGWSLHHIMNQIGKGKMNPDSIDKYFIDGRKGFQASDYKMYFTSNHDENSWNGTEFERLGDAAQTFAALCYLLPGMPLIYSGQESAYKKRIKFFDKDPIDWKKYEFSTFYQKLNELKKRNPALWNGSYGGEFKRIKISQYNQYIYVILRQKGDDKVLGIFNFSPKQLQSEFISTEHFGSYHNIFTNGRSTYNEKWMSFSVKPYSFEIFEGEKQQQ